MMHTLAPKEGAREKSFRVGRGNGSGRGKTAGRGTKGQRSRSGGRNKLRMLGMKQMLLSFPKVRGFNSRYDKACTLTLAQLERLPEGMVVTLESLRRAGLVLRTHHSVKIVGNDGLTKKLAISNVRVSAGAKAAIEKVGGSVTLPKKVKKAKDKNKKRNS